MHALTPRPIPAAGDFKPLLNKHGPVQTLPDSRVWQKKKKRYLLPYHRALSGSHL